jgi:hypothetical protein
MVPVCIAGRLEEMGKLRRANLQDFICPKYLLVFPFLHLAQLCENNPTGRESLGKAIPEDSLFRKPSFLL